LIDIAKLLKAEIIVGIGKYAEKRAQIAVQTAGLAIQVIYIYIYIIILYSISLIIIHQDFVYLMVQVMVLRHPSPRVVGNQNWNTIAMQQLNELGLLKFFEKKNI